MHRTELDSIGAVSVPLNKPYGAQTQRSINLYPTKHYKTLGDYKPLMIAFLQVKEAAAKTNRITGELDNVLALNIESVCTRLAVNYDPELYPVHAFHGGGGIAINMNVNEVIANLVNHSHYGNDYGTYAPSNPNDHVNLNHSTSDCLSTASHIAARDMCKKLMMSIDALIYAFDVISQQQVGKKKIARTCLQDAVDINFTDFWHGYTHSLTTTKKRISNISDELANINLSGNIIGRAGDCSSDFAEQSIDILNCVTVEQYQLSDNLFSASQSHDAMQSLASEVEQLARLMIKISKDLRLLSSGPDTGFGEIKLPAVQPGSSAMPGKINPTVPEFMVQSSMQAVGHCSTIKMAHDHGEIDYNPWGMIVITNLIDGINHLISGMNVLATHCIIGIEIDSEINQRNVNSLVPTVVKLKQLIGYSNTSDLVKSLNGDTAQLKAKLDELLKDESHSELIL